MVGIGFTGTRNGMTEAQKKRVKFIINNLHYLETDSPNEKIVAHHGDCVGADLDFHTIVRNHGGFWVKCHPPNKSNLRAYSLCDESVKEKGYLTRDRDIVDESEIVIGCPRENTEPEDDRAGGTWYTIRYAQRTDTVVIVVWPNGQIEVR